MIGVDGGATKTDAVVLGADGVVLGSGRAGGSNWERLGLERAVGEIALAIEGALGDAGVARDEIAASAFALADVDWPGDPARVDGALESLRLGGRRLVTNDSFAALRAGISGHAGCVSSAGTGAVAAGRNDAGETARTMALGFGELGGAGSIVEHALWACARMRETSGPDTALAGAFCDAVGVRDVDDLFEAITRGGLAVGAERAPLVLDVAAGGDAVAQALLAEQGDRSRTRCSASRAGCACSMARSSSWSRAACTSPGRCRWTTPSPRAWTESRPLARIVPLREPAVVGAGKLALDLLEEAP